MKQNVDREWSIIMGLDQQSKSWDGRTRPKISAKLKPCSCGKPMEAWVDTNGMWHASCSFEWTGDDFLGYDTWQELVNTWNRR